MAGQRGLAEKIRVGLAESELVVQDGELLYLEELWFRKPVRQHVKEFACLMATIMVVIAGVMLIKGKPLGTPFGLVVAALIVTTLGYRAPQLLHPVWQAWMKFAAALGIVSTFIILSVGWAILVIPLALILRAVGRQVMDLSFRTNAESYWEDRDERLHDFKLLERQF